MIIHPSIVSKKVFLSTPSHIYLYPHPMLKPYISHYTLSISSVGETAETLTLIPDIAGCIVFTPDQHHVHMKFWGATTKTVVVDNIDPPLRFFIEFRPGGSFCLTGIPQSTLLNEQIPLSSLLPKWQQLFEEAWFQTIDIDDFLELLEAFLISQIQFQESHAFLLDALSQITLGKDIQDICSFSSRHMNRIFHQTIGTSIKQYERLARINKAMTDIQDLQLSLTEVAYQAGYYDQAHFIHEFKQICGVTPGAYRKQMSAFYNEAFKF